MNCFLEIYALLNSNKMYSNCTHIFIHPICGIKKKLWKRMKEEKKVNLHGKNLCIHDKKKQRWRKNIICKRNQFTEVVSSFYFISSSFFSSFFQCCMHERKEEKSQLLHEIWIFNPLHIWFYYVAVSINRSSIFILSTKHTLHTSNSWNELEKAMANNNCYTV